LGVALLAAFFFGADFFRAAVFFRAGFFLAAGIVNPSFAASRLLADPIVYT
jgi:hypothetical protein